MTVYFIGAGPGDPELITIKAQKRIEACPVILYAGSLVPRAIFASVEHSAALILDTASMDLEQIMAEILEGRGGWAGHRARTLRRSFRLRRHWRTDQKT